MDIAVLASFPVETLFHYTWIWASVILDLVILVLVTINCLSRRKEPASSVLWILLTIFLPIIGAALYLSFGVDRVPDKGFEKHISDQKLLAERKARERDALPLVYWRRVHELRVEEPPEPFEKELNRAMNFLLPDYPLLGGNQITPLVNGDEFYPRLFDAIASAKHHINIQSFIIANDETGARLMDMLADKARSGVTVRVLFDRFGSTYAVWARFFSRFHNIPGLHIVGWTQVNFLKRHFQVNLRNHRKTAVIDGRIAFCGGINIGNDNITSPGYQPIRDYHFAISGPIVQELQYSFMRDWYHMTDEDPELLLTEAYFPHLEPTGKAQIRLANSGPTSEMEVIADIFFIAITSARKQVLVTTPYFVPTPDILRALRTAALRGVDVRLVVPKKNNHFIAGLAGRALYKDLMSAGVRIYERQPPFLHAKGLLIDSTIAIVGTANFDARSLRLNYETNLIVYEDAFVDKMKRIMLEDLSLSREVNQAEWARRSMSVRLAENFAYLLMPIL